MAKFFTPTKLSENIRETPEGYLLCLGVGIARTGWQEYGPGETPLDTGEDGRTWIYRDADEVFSPQTMASFNAKSITIKHPEEWVAPENWQELTRGIAQNIRRGEEKDEDGEEMLLADLLITEALAIKLVNNGLREVSCGYDAEYEETAKGEGRQYNIVGNHIALVEAGRAGSTYAIRDHKGDDEMNEKLKKLLEQIKTLGKTVDEAVKLEDVKAKKAKKATDADESKEKKDDKEKASDADSYDELMKAVKDLSDKVEALGGAKDDSEEKEEKSEDEDEKEDKEEKSEDDDEKEASIEERVKALEAAVSKMLEKLDSGSKDEDESESESEDDDDDMSGSEDEEIEKKEKKTGDAASAEILAPGVKVTKGEDLKVKALKVAYATQEGKEVIHTLTGGKKPTFDSKENVALLFNAASALMKQKRGNGLENTKTATVKDSDNTDTGPMTAEKLNEINRAHYAQK